MAGEDNGLGLSSFLDGSSAATAEPEGTTPSPAEAVKTEDQQAAPEVKPEEKKEITAEAKPAEEPAGDPKGEAKKPSFDWDSDENPYKKYAKQYKDTSEYSTRVNQQNQILQKQMEMINKKLDGTYDPAKDEPQQPTMEDAVRNGEIHGKVKASAALASQMYGEENVKKLILNPDAPFRAIENDPYVHARVLAADAPVLEAIAILEERAFQAKWGKTPREIEASIRKKAEEELTKTIEEKVEKKWAARLTLKERQVNGIGDAHAAGVDPKAKNAPTPLAQIFS